MDFAELTVQIVQRVIGEIFEVDQLVASRVNAAYQLVELEMHGASVAVLRVLNQEHDQKGNDRGAGVNRQLPCIGIMKNRPQHCPQDDLSECEEKGDWRSGVLGRGVRKSSKKIAKTRGRVLLIRIHATSSYAP